jgi:hypothetical protein
MLRIGLRHGQFGDITSDISSFISSAGQVGSVLSDVLQDPALPDVLSRIQTIKQLAPTSSAPGASTTGPGVGLSKAVPLLDAYIFYLKYPPVIPVAIGLVTILIFAIGFRSGKNKSATA